VVFGDVTRLDQLVVVALQLYDAKTASLVKREVVRAESTAQAMRDTRTAAQRLVPRPAAVPIVPIVGGAVLVVGALVGTLGVGGLWLADDTLSDPDARGFDKQRAIENAPWAWAAIAGGAVLVVAGAAVATAGFVLAE
jgi:hypothetical protein